MSSSSSEHLCRRFSFEEVVTATNNFDDALEVGKGGFGKVYKGILDHGASFVAVKRWDSSSKQGAQEFLAEINMLSRFKHIHLLSLIGFCDDDNEMILVYDYMIHGTLADHLYKNRKRKIESVPLSWVQRLKICIGAARGLDYLHTGTSILERVIHRDVKSSNILLDENWAAKISDFGLSRIGPADQESSDVITKRIQGTFDYMDPEYLVTRRFTRKSDVYSFGVVLLEVLSERPAVDRTLPDIEQWGLVRWGQQCISDGVPHKLKGPSLDWEILSTSLVEFVKIAGQCLHGRPEKRPTMSEVVVKLELSLALQLRTDVSLDDYSYTKGNSTEHVEVISSEQFSQLKTLAVDGKSLSFFICKNSESKAASKDSGGHISKSTNKVEDVKKDVSLTTGKTCLPSEVDGKAATIKWLQPCRRFSLDEILSATNHFDNSLIIGRGGFGNVYRGVIDNGKSLAAIKRLGVSSKQGLNEFKAELEILTVVRHSNIITLLGFCDSSNEMILVYEYMAFGTLADCCHSSRSYSAPWVSRLKMCISVAQALNYLHTSTSVDHVVIHRDIKSANIMLNENYIAKITDFGLSKVVPKGGYFSNGVMGTNGFTDGVSTAVMGTHGYLDPDYYMSGRVTSKADVYAFGVVLFEVLSGRKAIDMKVAESERNLSRWAKNLIIEGNVDQIVKHDLRGQILPDSLSRFVEIANKCVNDIARKRPIMAHILVQLQLALELQVGDSSVTDSQFSPTGQPYLRNEPLDSSRSQEFMNNIESSTDGFTKFFVKADKMIKAMQKARTSVSLTRPPYNRNEPLDSSISHDFINNIKSSTDARTKNFVEPDTMIKATQKARTFVSLTRPPYLRNDPLDSSRTREFMNNFESNTYMKTKTFVETEKMIKATQKARSFVSATAVSISGIFQRERLRNLAELTVSTNLKKFKLRDLRKATLNFSSDMKLAEGYIQSVFIGWFSKRKYTPSKVGVGMAVAIKKFNNRNIEAWKSEVELFGKFDHPNLVKLLGYCWEDDKELYIVYEFMKNGSLDKFIFNRGENPLSWSTRLKILIGAAQGLCFLHKTENGVVHRNIKTSNILLDGDFNAKVADFGLAKSGSAEGHRGYTATIEGAYGYLAPEYNETGCWYAKSDVYSFGAVLLEILTGKKVKEHYLQNCNEDGDADLVEQAWVFLKDETRLKKVIDPSLKNECRLEQALQFASLTLKCLETSPSDRPSIDEVLESLEQINGVNVQMEINLYHAENFVKPLTPKTERWDLMSYVPDLFKPYVTHIQDVEADGNCGYRCVADFMGWSNETGWLSVRHDMLEDLNNNQYLYNNFLYAEFGTSSRSILQHFDSPCSSEHWMEMPNMGHIIASKYNCTVVCIVPTAMWCCTIFPHNLQETGVTDDILVIAHIAGCHFVRAFLTEDSPIPTVHPVWEDMKTSGAEEWVKRYESRISKFVQLIGNVSLTKDSSPLQIS